MEGSIETGTYLHTKSGKLYEVIGTALQTETNEQQVIYKPLYKNEQKLFARPLSMFTGTVEIDGLKVDRFEKVSDGFAGFFLDGWYVFDNFAPFSIRYDNKYYPTAEHLFQSLKYINTAPGIAEKIRTMGSPADVFEYTRDAKLKSLREPNWDEVKVQNMEMIIRLKYEQHSFIQKVLKESGSLEIIEMNNNDSFWGWGKDYSGRNELGKIWMRIRDEVDA